MSSKPQNNFLIHCKIPIFINGFLLFCFAVYYFLLPFLTLIGYLNDPALKTGQIPQFAFSWHKQVSPKIESWAVDRVASETAANLNQKDISGTEWPMFGSVYYLWATEVLQTAWEENPSISPISPAVYANGAVEASAALITDPNHATWVKNYWGENYLEKENLFYRMLLISGLTSYQKLTGSQQYESLLRSQVESLSAELDESPFGLLDDYPNQCYPIDILPAIAAIYRADQVLGTDHSEFINRARRGFEDTRLDPYTGLPAYIANAKTGFGIGPSRGVGTAYVLIWAPEIWPDKTQDWYEKFDRFYWQEGWLLSGVREFDRLNNFPEWYFLDVDAGPVLAGYGTAASAFGLGAARANGRMDQAYPLSAEALVATWPLADGTLLGPRMLSNLSDAPYLGESALLFIFTRTVLPESIYPVNESLPGVVYFGLGFYFFLFIGLSWIALYPVLKGKFDFSKIMSRNHFLIWGFLTLAGLIGFLFMYKVLGIFFLLLARTFPQKRNG